MNDLEIVNFLTGYAGGVKEFAGQLGVTRQTIWTWRKEKFISAIGRFQVQRYARKKRITLPSDFMERGI